MIETKEESYYVIAVYVDGRPTSFVVSDRDGDMWSSVSLSHATKFSLWQSVEAQKLMNDYHAYRNRNNILQLKLIRVSSKITFEEVKVYHGVY